LPNASRRLYAGEIGSIQAARDAGFQYVAVAWPDYYRFLRMDSVIRKPLDAGGFEKIRHFYQSLPAECRLIWHAEPDANMYFHPGLSLYDITRPPRGG